MSVLKYLKYIVLLAVPLMLASCGDRVTIQPGEVARQLTTNGLEEEVYQPGVMRLDACWTSACPKIVRLQVNKTATDVVIDSLFLPKSNVDLTKVAVGIQFRIKSDRSSYNSSFSEVKPVQAASVEGNQGDGNRVLIITTDMVWDTFGKRKAPDAIVTALREYTVDEVLVNVPEIAAYTKNKINELLKDTPIEVTELGFPNGIGEVPEAVRDSKRRLFAIEDEKARDIKSLEVALEIEDQRQAVARKRAENDREIAVKIGTSVSTYQCLRSMDQFADAATANIAGTIVYSGDCGLGGNSSNQTALLPISTK